MTWQTPLLTYRCGACGTTVTGLMSYTYVLKVEEAHSKVCPGFAPQAAALCTCFEAGQNPECPTHGAFAGLRAG